MSKRVLAGAAAWIVIVALAFLADPIVGTAVFIFGGILVVIGYFASTWGEGATFEERELERSRRRAASREANTGKRDKDRARYQAALQRKAARESRKST